MLGNPTKNENRIDPNCLQLISYRLQLTGYRAQQVAAGYIGYSLHRLQVPQVTQVTDYTGYKLHMRTGS